MNMLGYHFRDNNGSSFLFMGLIDPNPAGSEIMILHQVPPMKDDGLKTSVNHPAEQMSTQVFLILRSILIQSVSESLTSSEPCMD